MSFYEAEPSGLSAEMLGKRYGLSEEESEALPEGQVGEVLMVCMTLKETLTHDESVGTWLRGQSLDLDNSRPLEVLKEEDGLPRVQRAAEAFVRGDAF